MKLFIAISKFSGNVMAGANGQYAFADPGTLKRSVGQAYKYQAQQKGVKPMDLYTIKVVSLEEIKVIGRDYE